MAIRVQRHANASKQATLLNGLGVSQLKWRVCGCGLNRFVHEGMKDISNVKVHLKTRSGNVNIHFNAHSDDVSYTRTITLACIFLYYSSYNITKCNFAIFLFLKGGDICFF